MRSLPLDDPRLVSYAELTLAMLLWGSLYPAGKPVLAAAVPPGHIALVRAGVAFVALGVLVVARGKLAEAAAELAGQPWRTALLGLISFFGSSLLAMLSLQYVPAAVAGIVTNTSPLWLSLAAALTGRAADARRLVLGAAVALGGVGVVLLRDEGAAAAVGAGVDPRGVALALLCSLVIAVGTLYTRRVIKGRDPLVLTGLACGWGALPLLGLAGLNGGAAPLLAQETSVQALLLYLGVGCTAANFALFNHALQRVPAERASAFQYLVPLFSALLAFVFLREALTWPLAVGGAAILVGVWLTQERHGRQPPATATQRAEGGPSG